MTISIRFAIVPSRVFGALYLPAGRTWEARVTVDGEEVASTRLSPSAALAAAFLDLRRQNPTLADSLPPSVLRAKIAQVEAAEERASQQAIAAFGGSVEHMASVEVKP